MESNLPLSISQIISDGNGMDASRHDFLIGLYAGVVAGFLVAALLWVSKTSGRALLQSISVLLNSGDTANLDGRWDSGTVDKPERDYTYREIIVLKKWFWMVRGTVDYESTARAEDSPTKHKQFKLKGTYRQRSLAAHYTSKESMSIGCISMRLTHDNRMEGGCIYYDDESDPPHVVADEYFWIRQ